MEQECASTADKGSYGSKMEDRLPLKRPSEETAGIQFFLVETRGPNWTDGLVFTVMAENHVWAEVMVRQWLDSNGRQYDDIDKVRVLVSQDLRAVVSVGAKLLDA